MYRKLDEPQDQSGRFRKEENLLSLLGIELVFSVRSAIAIPICRINLDYLNVKLVKDNSHTPCRAPTMPLRKRLLKATAQHGRECVN